MQTKTRRPIHVSRIELNIPQAEDNNDFDMLCFDGYAMGSNGIINVVVKYPSLWELSEGQINNAMLYMYGEEWKKNKSLKICFSDVMIVYNQVTQIQQVNTI